MRNCGSHIGQAYLADEVYGVYFGENWISVSPEVDYDQTLDEVHRVVEAYPGLYRDVQTYLRERIKEVLTGSSESIVVRIYGPDLAELQKQAKAIEQRIGDIPGIEDAHASLQTDLPHIEVETDLAKARAVGLTPGEIRRQTSALIASEEVSDIFARRQGVRRPRHGDPIGTRQRDRRGEHAAGHPVWTPGQAEGCGRRFRWARRRTPSSARSSRAASMSAPTWRAAR